MGQSVDFFSMINYDGALCRCLWAKFVMRHNVGEGFFWFFFFVYGFLFGEFCFNLSEKCLRDNFCRCLTEGRYAGG
jgi:hypothetical protein